MSEPSLPLSIQANNKPASLQALVDLLQHTGLKKPAIQKALDALAEQGKITAKASTGALLWPGGLFVLATWDEQQHWQYRIQAGPLGFVTQTANLSLIYSELGSLGVPVIPLPYSIPKFDSPPKGLWKDQDLYPVTVGSACHVEGGWYCGWISEFPT